MPFCLRVGLCYNDSSLLTEVFFLEALDIAHNAVDAASEKQASDILMLDVRGLSGFTDYFVILSGDSERQLKAIYEEVAHFLKKKGVTPLHYEGSAESGWILIDYNDVIVHIFSPTVREYYQLDKLWNEARPVVRIQ